MEFDKGPYRGSASLASDLLPTPFVRWRQSYGTASITDTEFIWSPHSSETEPGLFHSI
jgi:hypothetical protein